MLKPFKKPLIPILVAGLIGFTAMYAVATNKASDNNASSVSAASKFQVDLTSAKAIPDTITVPVGQAVQFNTKDGKKHNISLGEGGEEHEHTGKYSSGDFGKDEAWRVTFTEPGTFTFHDHYNPDINILVVAYKPATN